MPVVSAAAQQKQRAQQKAYRESVRGRTVRAAYAEANRLKKQEQERQRYATDPIWREARKAQTRAWKAAHPHYRLQDKLKPYALTVEEYDALLARQQGVCAICRRAPYVRLRGKVKALNVDHCHQTGRIRGLLCDCCNRAIGMLQDDPQLLLAGAAYLLGPT